MKTILAVITLAVTALGFTGCATAPTSTSSIATAIKDPNNQVKITQDGVTIAATAFLAKNPSYKADLAAAANTLVTIANGTLTTVTSADIGSFASTMPISSDAKSEVTAYATTALDLFTQDFGTTFPGLKVPYKAFLLAVANGLYVATGSGTVTIPSIPLTGAAATP